MLMIVMRLTALFWYGVEVLDREGCFEISVCTQSSNLEDNELFVHHRNESFRCSPEQ